MTISASLTASALTVAPTAVNSESGNPDLIPAPGSTAISTPNALNFFTVSGETATRGSDGWISLATAIFMGPPAVTSGLVAALLAPMFDFAFVVAHPNSATTAHYWHRASPKLQHD